MSTNVQIIPAGATSPVIYVTPLMSIQAGPQVQGGTVTVFTSPTQSGPFTAWPAGASLATASIRMLQNSWVYATAATQAATLAISDIGAGQGTNPLNEPIVNCQAVLASANVTTETIIASVKVPPLMLKPNFRMRMRGTVTMTNNVNAKTLQVRMNGIAGTLAFQSPALASNNNYAFEADWVGIGDGATLKGLGSGTTGGFGLSATAVTTLSRDYINNETEFVLTCTKATGTDVLQVESLIVNLEQ